MDANTAQKLDDEFREQIKLVREQCPGRFDEVADLAELFFVLKSMGFCNERLSKLGNILRLRLDEVLRTCC